MFSIDEPADYEDLNESSNYDMEDFNIDEICALAFKLADLAQMYNSRLQQLRATIEYHIHTRRLKIIFMSVLPI